MKKYVIILGVICCLWLSCCGKKEILTSEDIEEAIREELDTTYDYIRTFSYEIQKEKKKGKEYIVDVTVQATGKYAEFSIEGTLNFIEEDSIWNYESGTLEKVDYSLKDYPDSDYFFLQVVSDITDDSSEEFAPVSVSNQDNLVFVTVSRKRDHYLYNYTCDYTRGFEYEPIHENWVINDDYNDSYSHDPELADIEGSYYFESEYLLSPSGDLQISECSNDGFTVSYPGSHSSLSFHFTPSGEYICEIDEKHYKQINFVKEGENAYKLCLWRYNKGDGTSMGSREGTCLIA